MFYFMKRKLIVALSRGLMEYLFNFFKGGIEKNFDLGGYARNHLLLLAQIVFGLRSLTLGV